MSEIKQYMSNAVDDLEVSDPSLEDVYGRAVSRRRRRRIFRVGLAVAVALIALVTVNQIVGPSGSLDQRAVAEAAGRVTLPGLPLEAQSTADTMWVLSCQPCTPRGAGSVSRIDVSDLEIHEIAQFDSPASMVMSGGDLWVASDHGVVYRVDAASGRILATVQLPDLMFNGAEREFFVTNMAGGAGNIWVTSSWGSAVRISTVSGRIEDQVKIRPKSGSSVAVDSSGVWISLGVDGLLHIDETGKRTTVPIQVESGRRLAVDYVSADGDTVSVSGGWVASLDIQAGPPVYVETDEAGYALVDSTTYKVRKIESLPIMVARSAVDSADQSVVWYSGQQSREVVRSGPEGDIYLKLDVPGLVVAAHGDTFWVARKGEMIEKYSWSE